MSSSVPSPLVARTLLAVLLAALVGCTPMDLGPDPTIRHNAVGTHSDAVDLWRVDEIYVDVPRSLSVSIDPDVRFPGADIVWWEDPPGDRHAQVESILKAAVEEAVEDLDGPVPVRMRLTLKAFHALTPKARRSGRLGWHDIAFDLRLTGPDGGLIAEEINVSADVKAFQGEAAERAVLEGRTQRVRISARVTAVIRAWIGRPGQALPD